MSDNRHIQLPRLFHCLKHHCRRLNSYTIVRKGESTCIFQSRKISQFLTKLSGSDRCIGQYPDMSRFLDPLLQVFHLFFRVRYRSCVWHSSYGCKSAPGSGKCSSRNRFFLFPAWFTEMDMEINKSRSNEES